MTIQMKLIFKRFFDIIISMLLLLLLMPILILIAIMIKLDSQGSWLFTQTRVGKNGKCFKIYKFRTMVENLKSQNEFQLDADTLDNFIFQNKDDNRITKLGSFLRRSSIDELPQLLNVLIGNMSLVGPRPEIPEVVAKYSEKYKKRLTVTPGITGLAQINGRSALTLGETIDYDLEYIDNFSLYQDFKILCSTFMCVLRRNNAY